MSEENRRKLAIHFAMIGRLDHPYIEEFGLESIQKEADQHSKMAHVRAGKKKTKA